MPRATAWPSLFRCPQAGLGTWRHAAVVSSSDVLAVPKSVPLEVAATLTSGASTALRLLSDFGSVSSGDVVVQSGGESAVGEAVVQLASKRGVKTVTFVKVRTEAVLLVGVVSYWESVWSGRSVPADSHRWMMFYREMRGGVFFGEMRGRRHAGARPRLPTPACGAWRHALPPRAPTRHAHCACELQLTRECRSRNCLLWSPHDVFPFSFPSRLPFLPRSTGKCRVHHDG